MMKDFLNQKILIGVCGGIAAYKTAHLVRELTKLGAEVKVVMTESATRFVTPLTFQALSGQPVYTSLWEENHDHGMDHIALARWAEIFVIAPATANLLAKLSHGLADDLLTTLALVSEAPLIICPAMNHSMWSHAATQENVAKLKSRSVMIIGPEAGEAACGETGIGRLCEVEHLIQVLRLYPLQNLLLGQNCIITAGPTRERLDPVRFLSNDSSGKMGYALAYAAWIAGANVTLITGPTALTPPPGIKVISVESAAEMQEAVMKNLIKDCLFIGTAAVADYGFAVPEKRKIKKSADTHLSLQFVKNPDIISLVSESLLAGYVIGFAAETHHHIQYAQEKQASKKIDLMVANLVGPGLGFNQEINQVTLITKKSQVDLPAMHKTRLAGEILKAYKTSSS